MAPTIDDIIAWLARVPFFGRQLVNFALERSYQRHACGSCGAHAEIVVAEIVKAPLAVLSDVGKQRHGKHFVAGSAPGAAAAAAAAPAPESPASGAAESSPATPQSPSSSSPAASVVFRCESCKTGRLGVHTYKGDATDGSKAVLMERIVRIFEVMPDVIATSMNADAARSFKLEDIFWVD
jgi:hypothetical protein